MVTGFSKATRDNSKNKSTMNATVDINPSLVQDTCISELTCISKVMQLIRFERPGGLLAYNNDQNNSCPEYIVLALTISTRSYGTKRKPPCICVMELVSLSCNRVFISAESIGRSWCKIAIATKWYQFHTTDKFGFLFMPWITDQYTFVRYTKLINKIDITVAKIITFSIMTT